MHAYVYIIKYYDVRRYIMRRYTDINISRITSSIASGRRLACNSPSMIFISEFATSGYLPI